MTNFATKKLKMRTLKGSETSHVVGAGDPPGDGGFWPTMCYPCFGSNCPKCKDDQGRNKQK